MVTYWQSIIVGVSRSIVWGVLQVLRDPLDISGIVVSMEILAVGDGYFEIRDGH